MRLSRILHWQLTHTLATSANAAILEFQGEKEGAITAAWAVLHVIYLTATMVIMKGMIQRSPTKRDIYWFIKFKALARAVREYQWKPALPVITGESESG
jgi:hypothetical protein